jgi:hypothetical protein
MRTHAQDAEGQNRPREIRVTVVIANRYAFDAEVVTGRQIKEKADIPAGFALHRRMRGGNEVIRDDDSAELRDGDHLFARPPGVPSSRGDGSEGVSG